MGRGVTADRMLAQYACAKSEVSCIIGNIFAELSPPCNACGVECITISGTTHSGNTGTLVITAAGFDFDGNDADIELIAQIRKGWCIYATSGGERAIGI